jgi:hypothetical protein
MGLDVFPGLFFSIFPAENLIPPCGFLAENIEKSAKNTIKPRENCNFRPKNAREDPR